MLLCYIKNLFLSRNIDLENFTSSYSSAIKAFVMILAKKQMRDGQIDFDFIHKLYEKIDIESFVNK